MNESVPFDAGKLVTTEDEFEAEEALQVCEAARRPGYGSRLRIWNRVQSGARQMTESAVRSRATPRRLWGSTQGSGKVFRCRRGLLALMAFVGNGT